MLARMTPDHEWARERVATFPASWQGRILGEWAKEHESDRQGANLGVLRMSKDLGALRLPLDATDDQICAAADTLAMRCMDASRETIQPGRSYLKTSIPLEPVHFKPVFPLVESRWQQQQIFSAGIKGMRRKMNAIVAGQGIEPPNMCHMSDRGAIARMTDPQWWRGKLRKHHGRQVEAAAIALGYVHRHDEIYASTLTVLRRAEQIARNQKMMEGTEATNELGQTYTLAELAAKGSGNKSIRRAELMTRIAGFERIARDMGHAGLFLTITCPSRMHRIKQVANGAKCIQNKKYDGTTPRQAQSYLAKVWGRIRSALHRGGVKIYGFRIAEPQHDGTPHWHLLVFHEVGLLEKIKHDVRRYALREQPFESGAFQHRCDFKEIDWERGSAAGYIAKYVAKNIDGYKLEKDLYGQPIIETTQRVEAWASTWGIRQFQQVGGPPVTVWRELRRVASVPSDAPQYLIDAHQAVNKSPVIKSQMTDQQRYEAGAKWDLYCRAQGGVFCGRNYRIRIEKAEQPGRMNRYGEPSGEVPMGVSVWEHFQPEWMTPFLVSKGCAYKPRKLIVESCRHVWQIKRAQPANGEVSTAQASPAPWTCVNNCTKGGHTGHQTDARADRGSESGLWEHGRDGKDGGGTGFQAPDFAAGSPGDSPGSGTVH